MSPIWSARIAGIRFGCYRYKEVHAGRADRISRLVNYHGQYYNKYRDTILGGQCN
jgi:hypothetical protein